MGAQLELCLEWVEIKLKLGLRRNEALVRERETGRDVTGRFGQLLGGEEVWWEDGSGLQDADKLYGQLRMCHGAIFRRGERGFSVPVCPGVWEYFGPGGRQLRVRC